MRSHADHVAQRSAGLLLMAISGGHLLVALLLLPASGQENAAAGEPQKAAAPQLLEKKIRVIDAEGRPVAGAKVVPWAVRSRLGHGKWSEKGQFHSEPPTLTTDVDGQATIPFPPFVDKDQQVRPEQLSCQVEHPDFATTAYNNVDVNPAGLDDVSTITMRSGALIEAIATAPDTKIDSEFLYAAWSVSGMNDGERRFTPEGALILPRLPEGPQHIQLVYAPEGGPVMFSDVQTLELVDGAKHKLELALKPSVRVEGQLDGDVARPIKNGRVVARVLLPDAPGDVRALQWHVYATMRINGSFTFENLPRGNLQVIALCDGSMAESGEPPDFATDRERERPVSSFSRPQVFALEQDTNHILVKMTPTADCLIVLKDPEGNPVVGAKCAFWPNVGWWGQGGSQIYCEPLYNSLDLLKDPEATRKLWGNYTLFSATTNEEGEALVRNLPPKPSSFIVEHDTLQLPGDEGAFSEGNVALKPGERKEVTMRLVKKRKGNGE